MNKYVSPIIEIENIEVEGIMDWGFSNENDIPSVDDSDIPLPGGGNSGGGTGGGSSELPTIPNAYKQYFNK